MHYLSIAEIRDLEKQATEKGITCADLMERAGQGAAEYIKRNYPLAKYKNICCLCGKGNNAGDGFVAARYLAATGYQVTLLLVEMAHYQYPAQENWLKVSMLPCVDLSNTKLARAEIMSADLLLDAMLGIGFSGELAAPYRDTVCAINLAHKPIISLDIPTGIHGDKGVTSPLFVRPKETLTFIAPKLAMRCKKPPAIFGKITVIDIGI